MADKFFWIANHPGLDFVNTEAVDGRGRRMELLRGWHDVVAWADAAGLLETPSGDPRRVVDGRRARRALDWARRLRSGARQVLDSEADAHGAGAEMLADAVADVPVRLVYRPDAAADLPPLASRDAIDTLRLALALSVLDATALDRSRVRRCGNERCVLLFYDTSKNRSRRWCDMAVCGNRAKAAAHYQRSRRAAGPREQRARPAR
jgi:predicted RNA-binding Zn ribbon-like protein